MNSSKSVLQAEVAAIQAQWNNLDSEVFRWLAELLSTQSVKLVVTGIGKSAIAARKIAATIATFNVASVFIDPVGLFHGELGILREGDIVLMLSQSGETDELIRLIPSLKEKRCRIYAIVGREQSTLARETWCMVTGIEQEPFLKVPTASSAAAVAIGDALAVEIGIRKGYSAEEFLKNHPGGYIGKTLRDG